jgi:hypothetical protein
VYCDTDLALCRRVLSRARLAHVSIVNWARHLIPIARELGVVVAADLQDVVTADDPYRRDFVVGADILLFSSVNHEDPAPLIEAYRRLNPTVICVVGMGARGAALGTVDGVPRFDPSRTTRRSSTPTAPASSLAVGFLASHVLDGSLADAGARPDPRAIRAGRDRAGLTGGSCRALRRAAGRCIGSG